MEVMANWGVGVVGNWGSNDLKKRVRKVVRELLRWKNDRE